MKSVLTFCQGQFGTGNEVYKLVVCFCCLASWQMWHLPTCMQHHIQTRIIEPILYSFYGLLISNYPTRPLPRSFQKKNSLRVVLRMHSLQPRDKYPSCRTNPSTSRVVPSFSSTYISWKLGHGLYLVFNLSKSFTTVDILVKMNIRWVRGSMALFSTPALWRRVNV